MQIQPWLTTTTLMAVRTLITVTLSLSEIPWVYEVSILAGLMLSSVSALASEHRPRPKHSKVSTILESDYRQSYT